MFQGPFRLILMVLILGLPQAQAQVLFESADNEAFHLVINGFQQTEVPLERLQISGLPSGEHELIFLLEDGRRLQRKLSWREKERRKYLLTENYRGKFQLRLRGHQDTEAYTALSIAYTEKVPYQEKVAIPVASQAKDSLGPSLSAADTLKKPEAIAVTIEPVTETAPAPEAKQEQAQEVENSSTAVSSQPIATANHGAADAPNDSASFERFIIALELNSFEYDKVLAAQQYLGEHSMGVDELKKVLASFKYDQTRLQFLDFFLQKEKINKTELATLVGVFDYDLSRQAAEKMISNE